MGDTVSSRTLFGDDATSVVVQFQIEIVHLPTDAIGSDGTDGVLMNASTGIEVMVDVDKSCSHDVQLLSYGFLEMSLSCDFDNFLFILPPTAKQLMANRRFDIYKNIDEY